MDVFERPVRTAGSATCGGGAASPTPGRLEIFLCVMTGQGRSLLVNFWYAHPVGHAIEALRYCLGYHRADPSLRISLLLNAATAVELADFCPFVERTYGVAFTGFHDGSTNPAPALRAVPEGCQNSDSG
jgi:hypothetical protein